MEFSLLGPLIVRCGGEVLPVQRGKQRAVLAALLLRANRVVAVADLADALWDGDRPPSAQVTVQNYVKRLRQALGDADRSRIITQPRGYQILVQPGELDLSRFRDLLTAAQASARNGSWADAATNAADALGLWRGDPLEDVDSELLRREVPRLAEMRLQAQETRIEADLRLGRHAELINELRQLTDAYPLRERFWALLMLALYRSGRQADALVAYQRAREALVKELGAEPGAELRSVQQRMLIGDVDAEDWTRPRASATAGVLRPPVPSGSGAKRQDVPRQLPAPVRGFTGRAAELDQLSQLLDDASGETLGMALISAIDGTAGVGKTALAVHWAHQVAARFPDGQLYVNLRGYDRGQPTPPTDALAGFLRSLGVHDQDIPPEEDDRAARYRSLLAGKRMLVVLDNARSADQVRPLLPGTPTCAVVVTSRDALAGLVARDGATRLDLDVLPLEDAVALLRRLIGARVDAEPDKAAELADHCCRLPLALRVAAERAVSRPDVPLAGLVGELADLRTRLDRLAAGGDPRAQVRNVFSWSYRHLDPDDARTFRLLGLHPGPHITSPAAASAAGVALPAARRCLRELTHASLLAEHLPGRFGFHDLLRAYAADQARATEDQQARLESTGRILDHYLHTAADAALLINPARDRITVHPHRPGVTPEHLADHQQAMDWMQAEYQVLLAATTLADSSGFDVHAWQIPWTMADFLDLRCRWRDMAAAQRTALAAAGRLGDTNGQATSLRVLAHACVRLGDHDQARAHYAASLALYRQLGDRLGEARVQQSLSLLAGSQGRYADLLSHAEQALRMYQAIGNRVREAAVLNNVGYAHALLGDYQQARVICQQAVSLSAELGLRYDEASAWDSLGYSELHLGNLAEATACYQRALGIFREFGDRYNEARTLTYLGDARQACGDLQQARQAWQQALDILDELDHPGADELRGKLRSAARVAPA